MLSLHRVCYNYCPVAVNPPKGRKLLMVEQPKAEWKNYYRILRVSPEAKPKTIRSSYKRLTKLYGYLISKMPEEPAYEESMKAIEEAYQVLSDSARRKTYDQAFKTRLDSLEADKPIEEQIYKLAVLIDREASKRKKIRDPLRLPKKVWRAVIAVLASLLLITAGGTSLAFAQPQNALATPFKGVAATAVQTSVGAIGLIEEVRGVAALYERNIVYTALQSMRITERLAMVPVVTVPTNDMASFPSPGHPLFPDYLDKRFSQFKYTVDSDGIVTVDTSGATTDAFLARLKQLLNQLEEK